MLGRVGSRILENRLIQYLNAPVPTTYLSYCNKELNNKMLDNYDNNALKAWFKKKIRLLGGQRIVY